MDSDQDDVYEDGDYREIYSGDDDDDVFDDGDFLDSNVKNSQPQQQQPSYIILREVDILRRQEEDITTVSTILSISRAWSILLLCHYDWCISKVQDAWFTDEEKVRKSVGLLEKPVVVLEIPENVNREFTCEICFEIFSFDKMTSSVCGHLYCVSCLTCYISTSINDGPGCLMLRCPEPSCSVAIDQDLIDQLISDENKEKFSRYLLRSYIETNRKAKWCPAPECVYAIEFDHGQVGSTTKSATYDVNCLCSYSFCWNCTEEVHRPVDCETVAKWLLKHSCEAENVTYILAYTKPCPKCKRPIEKNQGCNHMTCSAPCKFQFCWICLHPWSDHQRTTCNAYDSAGKEDGDDKKRKKARKYLEKYTHYYERWAVNESSRQKAKADLRELQTTKLDILRANQTETLWKLEFIREAWIQIVECRRVLKWTYAYGYYLPEEEHGKRQLFEYLQGQAETGLERLHHCVEKELQIYIEAEGPLMVPGFEEFRIKLVELTNVTRNYFENLVQALENGLSDVESHGKSSRKGRMRKSLEGGEDGHTMEEQ
ncbi:probable E3 ubiquitin-protein ligase ARI8 [Macadamia integrifolia]|uniref:probable E3 ubiquitin-protein ligase ARI8 n=1 Tax=Macadamia integrifolia TaxID=60698 RepID=UPI001C4F6658|nr:probable E3 ubiquitin-protein ligase ARI8 [Macadamia integrifolia]